MNRLHVQLIACLVVACGGPIAMDAGPPPLTLACPVSERACPCPGGSEGVQVCFEPNAVWSQCACAAPDASVVDAGLSVDAGVPSDAGVAVDGGRRDGGFPPCPSPLRCMALGASGLSACAVPAGGFPACSDAGTCEALPGATCRTLQGTDRCLRLCSTP